MTREAKQHQVNSALFELEFALIRLTGLIKDRPSATNEITGLQIEVMNHKQKILELAGGAL